MLKEVIAAVVSGFVVLGLTACVPTERSPQESARDIVERWVAASKRADEDAAQALSCGSILGGVNSDTAGFESYELEVFPQTGGELIVEVTKTYSDYPDLVSTLGVRTDGELCISWVR